MARTRRGRAAGGGAAGGRVPGEWPIRRADSGFTFATALEDGTVGLTFDTCDSGTVEHNIPSIGWSGVVPIRRIVTGNVGWCESLIGQ